MEGTRPMSIDTVPETYPSEATTTNLPHVPQQPEHSIDATMSYPTLSTPSSSLQSTTMSTTSKALFVLPSPSKDTTRSYLMSFRVPTNYLTRFHKIITGPLDPALVMPPKNSSRNKERKRSIVLSSTVRSVTSVPSIAKGYALLPEHPSSSKSNIKASMSRMHIDQPEKDPETKMTELMQLKTLKTRQEDLCQLKDHIHQLSQALEGKEAVLEEMRSERKLLQNELSSYAAMIKQIQHDLELATTAEQHLAHERDQLATNLARIRDHDYDKLKQEVDVLRAQHGLRPLPNLEQEHEESIGRYLEERRGRWREEGGGDAQSGATTATLASSSSAGAGASRSAASVSAQAPSTPSSRQRNDSSRCRENSQTRRLRTSGSSNSSRQDHEPENRRSTQASSSSRRRSRSRSPSRTHRNDSSRSSRRYKR